MDTHFGFDEFGKPIPGFSTSHAPNDDGDDDDDGAVVRDMVASASLESDDSEFSSDVEIVDGEQATEDITKPLLAPAISTQLQAASGLFIEDRHRAADASVKSTPTPHKHFRDMLASNPARLRNIAMIGALHHGKTSIVALLAGKASASTRGKHGAALQPLSQLPFKRRPDEVQRCMTLKTNFSTLMIDGPDSVTGKAFPTTLVTVVDTPGHASLEAEVSVAVRLADSAIICVDVVEGVLQHTIQAITIAALEGLPFVLVITKLDRCILDLRLPPADAYHKIFGIVQSVNNAIAATGSDAFVSPQLGTVLFTSCRLGLCFTLESFAYKYITSRRLTVSASTLATKLWGPITYHVEQKAFVKLTKTFEETPSFVEFILMPLYKIVAHAVTGKAQESLHAAELSSRPHGPLQAAQEAVVHFCGSPQDALRVAILNVVPSPLVHAQRLLHASAVDQQLTLGGFSVVPCCRLQDSNTSFAVVRVVSGTISTKHTSVVVDEKAEVLEPFFTAPIEDIITPTDAGIERVETLHAGQIALLCGRGLIEKLTSNAVLFQTVDGVVDTNRDDCFDALNTIQLLPLKAAAGSTPPVASVNIEPVRPKDLPKLRKCVQTLVRTTPGLDARAEETGEFTVIGHSEFQLDVALKDLRHTLCPDIHLKLSSPFVEFSESVAQRRGVLAMPLDHGASIRIGFVSGALTPELASDVENGLFSDLSGDGVCKVWTLLHQKHHWDVFESRRVVAVGPSTKGGTNLLVNDLVDDLEEDMLSHVGVQEAVVQGFQSAMRSGPLCGEPLRHVKASIISLQESRGLRARLLVDSDEHVLETVSRELIRATKKYVTQSLFGASLRLMEPVVDFDIIMPVNHQWSMETIDDVIQNRRGTVLLRDMIPATPLQRVKVLMPAIDSFGFESQLRTLTIGEAFCSQRFSHWEHVPGDPLNKNAMLSDKSHPARGEHMARDFTIKTRARKGLNTDEIEAVLRSD